MAHIYKGINVVGTARTVSPLTKRSCEVCQTTLINSVAPLPRPRCWLNQPEKRELVVGSGIILACPSWLFLLAIWACTQLINWPKSMFVILETMASGSKESGIDRINFVTFPSSDTVWSKAARSSMIPIKSDTLISQDLFSSNEIVMRRFCKFDISCWIEVVQIRLSSSQSSLADSESSSTICRVFWKMASSKQKCYST